MPRGDRAFLEVTDRAPCPICGSGGWCRVARDGSVVLCRREPNGGRPRQDACGPYFVHRTRPGHAPIPVEIDALSAGKVPDLAPVEVRSRAYVALLGALSLDVAHRDALRARGLPDGEIVRRMYRTLPPPGPPWRREDVARELARWFTADLLAGVPGFVRRTSQRTGRPYWTIAGPPGMLVPVRDLHGRIVAMQIRRDEAGDGPRYLWLSSSREGGPGSGAPVHVPLSLDDGHDLERVRLTEGPLKADSATCLDPDRLLTLGVPGVQTWRAALPALEALGARIVQLAFDADWRTNRHVARALLDAADGLEVAGYSVAIETWTTDGDGNPKGIDDLLVTGRLPEVIA